ncbi:MAG: 1-deoxy-D-xylulose-5-phosphate synthase [Thermoleophilia bacterium]|nr:1-deoxy-D-xylulose-5-phosphate synthase [Thermoleophilia bacterium]MDH3724259.1 1-deoxy-D-xylulose-5-phosphate synthase [Thermoleophilia bacterium]
MTHSDPAYPLLSGITEPADVHALGDEQLELLAGEMRRAIVDTVSKTGGHLGASLGTIELTIALHAELESPRDKLIWDVGHQAYGHKLLTGRLAEFETLRQHRGLSGFLRRAESEHDVIGAGHASTSISYATGLAEAQRLSGARTGHVVCVIGDGALTGGMAYEGLNHAGALGSPITVVLNDNGMSISKNVGALSTMFQRVRYDKTLSKVRGELERGLARIPGVSDLGGAMKDATKAFFSPGHLFEALGFAYIGPVDGHDVGAMRGALRLAVRMGRPVLIHAKTVKGKGYAPAEADTEAMHGATPFEPESGKAESSSGGPPTYTSVFGRALLREAEQNSEVVGITAAMLKGTGLDQLMERYPERTYDVGIAEQHAVVFAGGLAIAGKRPVCAIYSTFLQRAFDPIIHDIAIQQLPVVLAIDRGGLVGADGATHHGVFDLAYLRPIPGLTLMAPKDEAELVDMLHTALRIDAPVALRYPRGAGRGTPVPETPTKLQIGRGEILESGNVVALVGYGYGAALALDAAPMIEAVTGERPTVVNARFCKPLDAALMHDLAREHDLIVTIEDHMLQGGFGSAVLEELAGTRAGVLCIGLPDCFIEQGGRGALLEEAGLTAEQVATMTVAALTQGADAVISA